MNAMMTPSWVFVLLAEGGITRTYYSDSEETRLCSYFRVLRT